MMLSVRSDSPPSDRGMLPLINIVFLLMIFFMLVGAVSPPGAFDPEPLRAESGLPAERDPDTLLISIAGPMAIGSQVFAPPDLELNIRNWQIQNPHRPLRVRADARLPADALIQILEALRGAGIERIELVTRRRQS